MSVAGRARCHGTLATLERVVSGSYSTTTRSATKVVDEHEIHVTIREYRLTELNETIRASDRALFLPREETPQRPTPDDAILFKNGGERWRIQSVRPVTLRGDEPHYELQIRRHT